MRRILAGFVLLGLLSSFGCFTADDRRQWNEAVKDLKGENQEMKYFGAGQKSSSSSN
jgi:hypothetical protein